MKTEITKAYKWGFMLSEQELRRVNQTCQELTAKADGNFIRNLLSATLHDGSVVETHDLEDLLKLENGGAKQIAGIKLEFDDGKENSDWRIHVSFKDGNRDSSSWNAASYKVIGQSRDWAFLSASEIDERIRKTRTVSLPYLAGSKWLVVAPIVISLFLFIQISDSFMGASLNQALSEVEAKYREGSLSSPIEAMILLERAKLANSHSRYFYALVLVAYVLPISVTWGLSKILPWAFPAYNFYWGDYKEVYDRRRSITTVFWTVVVLGLIVSLIAAAIDRYLMR